MENNLFTREDTRCVKAAAAIMMMAHHIFAFSDRLPTGYSYNSLLFSEVSLYNFGQFCRVCIALFLFVGGYGLYKQHAAGKCTLPTLLVRQYKQYWKVFILFVPVGLILFAKQPEYCADTAIYTAYTDSTFQEFVSNWIGWSSSYNREWWFFRTYLLVSFVGLAYMGVVRKHYGFCPEALLVILLTIVNRHVLNSPPSGSMLEGLKGNVLYSCFILIDQWSDPSTFFMGILFAKYDGIHRLREMLSKYAKGIRFAIALAGLIVVYMARAHIFWDQTDLLLAPLFVVCWLELVHSVPLGLGRKIFGFIGTHSANIWLIHGFYCYYFYPVVKAVYWTNNPIITLLTLTAFTLISSILLTWFYKGLSRIAQKLNPAPKSALSVNQ